VILKARASARAFLFMVKLPRSKLEVIVSEPSAGDHRRHPRLRVVLPLKYRLLESPSGEAMERDFHNSHNLVYDISRGGFFLSTKNFLDPESLIWVEFPLEAFRAVFSGRARVVRCNNFNEPIDGRYEYGLQFEALDPGNHSLLEEFVKSLNPSA
jgi:c-di-GMP-binding flagellar brake protein YcgR